MPEVQTSTVSGEMTLRFLQFVQMHTQNTLFCLGRVGGGKPNLDMGKILLDQLAALSVKTQGNLTPDEDAALQNALGSLETAYAETRRENQETRKS